MFEEFFQNLFWAITLGSVWSVVVYYYSNRANFRRANNQSIFCFIFLIVVLLILWIHAYKVLWQNQEIYCQKLDAMFQKTIFNLEVGNLHSVYK